MNKIVINFGSIVISIFFIRIALIIQILNAIIEVKLHNKANFFARKFKNSIIKEFQSVKFLDFINKLPKLSMELLVVSMLCISIIIALYLNFSIESLLPIFVLYFFAALRLYPSINGLLIHRLGIINNQISFNKVYDEFKNASASSENPNERNNENFSFDHKILVKNLNVLKLNENCYSLICPNLE